jgi:Ca2+-binding RTX toxin-like protein
MAFYDLSNNSDSVILVPGLSAIPGSIPYSIGTSVRALGGNDSVIGSLEADDINGNQGNDNIDGFDGNDFLRGGQGDDTVYGFNGNDTVNGNNGNDLVSGVAGDDIVRGGQGNDTLFGGDGNDTLFGDLGSDLLVGDTSSTGNDVFVLRTDNAVSDPTLVDAIADFGDGFDQIGLTGGLTESSISLVSGGGSLPGTPDDTLIRIGTSGDFLGGVVGVKPAELVGKFISV